MKLFHHAERYDRHAGRLGAKLYARVVADAAAVRLPDGAHVLDAGTGPGTHSEGAGRRTPDLGRRGRRPRAGHDRARSRAGPGRAGHLHRR
jgi:hypothetical protein